MKMGKERAQTKTRKKVANEKGGETAKYTMCHLTKAKLIYEDLETLQIQLEDLSYKAKKKGGKEKEKEIC